MYKAGEIYTKVEVGIMSECQNCRCHDKGRNEIIFIGDFICPWTYLGFVRLLKAVGNKEIDVLWRPFELDRNTPEAGEDRKEQRIRKFGSLEASLEKDAKVREASKDDGINFQHDLIKKTPNTFKAHRLMQLAESEGKDTAKLALLIFSAYFTEGKDIGDKSVLIELGAQVGLEKDKLKAFLEGDLGVEQLRQTEEAVREQKIDYIPFVIIGNHTFSGSESKEKYAKAIDSQFPEVMK